MAFNISLCKKCAVHKMSLFKWVANQTIEECSYKGNGDPKFLDSGGHDVRDAFVLLDDTDETDFEEMLEKMFVEFSKVNTVFCGVKKDFIERNIKSVPRACPYRLEHLLK